jgi:asparagine synthase (glutamine-hydrolysing)
MCGILCIYCKNKEENLDQIREGHKMLSNRGPSCSRISKDSNGNIMGFRRLQIVDLTEKGMQPFVQGEVQVVCNGEIFNHKDLEKLHQLECDSTSDCECILHLYKKEGFDRTITQLNGDFAIILIDGDHMYFGRDRIGVRPLFFGRTKSGNLALASYARALTNYCDDVQQVPPGWGHYCVYTDTIIFSEYSYPSTYSELRSDIHTQIQYTLTKSVKDRLMSDRPVACLLSGGLDSSLIVSILCKLIGPKNVRTYSIGMTGSIDLYHANIVAKSLGTIHTEIQFTPEEGFAAITDVIRDLESYDITTIRASVPMWLLAKWISKNTKDIVLFSGEGADELFCGYLYFHYAPSSDELKKESKKLVKSLYLYDALRADRCISSHGLELRVPFLDRHLVDLCFSIPGDSIKPQKGMEKHLLRISFIDDYLPDEVLWRRKDGMSDAVSGLGKKWYEQLGEFIEPLVKDEDFHKTNFPSKEAMWYKQVYDDCFPTYQPKYDYWLPKWVEHGGEPSGRILNVYDSK